MLIKMPNAKSIFKSLLYFVLCLIVIAVAWAAYINYHGDEKPDAGRDVFYAVSEKPVPDDQNIAVAISGITAPAGSDVFEFGRFILNTYKNTENNDDVKKLISQKDSLAFVGNAEELDCWFYSENQQLKNDESCADEARIRKLLADNKVLLNRYFDLYKLPYFQGVSKNNLIMIQINDLLQAEIRLDANQLQFDVAFEKWKKNHTFIKHLLKQDCNLLNCMTAVALLGSSSKTLEHLLLKKPDLASTHYQELLTLLEPSNINLEAMLRLEVSGKYEVFNSKSFKQQLHINYLKNRHYRADMDFLIEARKSPFNYVHSENTLREKGYRRPHSIIDIDWLNPINSILSKYEYISIYNKLNLIQKMHIKNAQIQLLRLNVQIKQQDIAESQIQAFLNNARAASNNPFTNNPMQYDEKKKVIYCIQPWSGDKTEVRL